MFLPKRYIKKDPPEPPQKQQQKSTSKSVQNLNNKRL